MTSFRYGNARRIWQERLQFRIDELMYRHRPGTGQQESRHLDSCSLFPWQRWEVMPFLISSGTGLLLGLFCRFVGPRKIRIFEPLASYLTPDSEIGAIETYVRLVGLVEAEREVTKLLSHISRLGDNEPHHFTLSGFIRSILARPQCLLNGMTDHRARERAGDKNGIFGALDHILTFVALSD